MHVEPQTDVLGNVVINDFRGEYFFLSNFYLREMELDGVLFHSREQAYMWCKTEIPEEKAAILKCDTPGKVKRFASDPANVTLRPMWDTLRASEMYRVVLASFTQHPDLAERLIATGEAFLVEGNWWHDQFFGDCYCEKCKDKTGLFQLNRAMTLLSQYVNRYKISLFLCAINLVVLGWDIHIQNRMGVLLAIGCLFLNGTGAVGNYCLRGYLKQKQREKLIQSTIGI